MSYLTIEKGHRLYYQMLKGAGGKGAGKPYLIFLHEALGCTAMWKDFPEKLCLKCGCPGLVYDRLGYGKSSPDSQSRTIDYLHNSALHELPKLLALVIPDKPYILIGHSDGGSINLLLGAERPSMLKGIITEAAHVFVDQKTLAGIQDAEMAWERGKLKGLWKYHGENTKTVFRAWSETWQAEWFQTWNIENMLAKVEVPLLVIQGQDDQYGAIEQATTIAEKCSGYSQLALIENCAHAPHKEAQQRILDLMSKFIDQRCL